MMLFTRPHRLLLTNFVASHPTKSYWNSPASYSPASTAPSNEAGRYLIVDQTHIRSHPAVWYRTTDFLSGSPRADLKVFVITSLLKHHPPLHSPSLSCGIAPLARESNHDDERSLEAVLDLL